MEKYKEEVYKCSKCGLCKSVCPVFLATKNEMHLPRGRYIILNRFYNSKENPSKNFIKDLDICLNCNLCKDFCPSSINSADIFTAFKNYFKYKYSIIHFSTIYKIKLYLKSLLKVKKKIESDKTAQIAYFEGCHNKYTNNGDTKDCIDLIKKTNTNKIKIISECCGYPYLNEGNLSEFEKNTNHLIDKIKNCNVIICSCDSCFNMLEKIIKENQLNCKITTVDKFLSEKNISSENEFLYFKPLIRKSEAPNGAITINTKIMCSLMENFLLLKHKKIADKITENMKNDLAKYDGKTIITTCPISQTGLNKVLKKLKINTNVILYASYLKKTINKKYID